jgi:hypothetical protein
VRDVMVDLEGFDEPPSDPSACPGLDLSVPCSSVGPYLHFRTVSQRVFPSFYVQ